MWAKVKSGFIAFSATTRDTFGCTGNNGDVMDDDGDNNFVADTNGSSSSVSFVEVDFLRSDLNHQRGYPDNAIRTAKYTLASGLPLSLLYQFYKISNFYFLLVMVITLVPGASPINPFSSVVPLCIVLGAGIIKDLWEDWKRRKADQLANEMIVHVLRVPMHTDKSARARAATGVTISPVSDTPDGEGSGGSDGVDPLLPTAKPRLPTQQQHAEQQHHTTTSDSDEHHNASTTTANTAAVADNSSSSNRVAGSSGGGAPRDRKRKRAVHFLFPSEKSRSRNSLQAGEFVSGTASSPRPTETDPSSKAATGAEQQPPRSPPNGVVTGPRQPSLLKPTHTQASSESVGPTPATTAATAAAAAVSAEPRVSFQPIRSCDVYPGDIMLFRLGEEVKADCLILNTSLPDGLTYIETANLDGETNAKTRRAKIQTVEALGTVEDIIECSLGVPASNVAAVFAKMNGGDTANAQGSSSGGANGDVPPPTKITVDSCGAVGAHVATTPAQEANNVAVAAANAQHVSPAELAKAPADVEVSSRHNVTSHGPAKSAAETKHLLSQVTSSASDAAGNTPAEAEQGGGEDPHAFALSTHLEREEREAVENKHSSAHVGYHRRSHSDPTTLHAESYARATLPLVVSGADVSLAASEPFFANIPSAGGTPGDVALSRVWHQRHQTLDERLVEDGAIPVPRHVQELSAQYERAVHSRTNSAGAHTPSRYTRSRRGDTSLLEDTESVFVDGDSGQHREHFRTSSLGPSAHDSSLRVRHSLTVSPSAGERSRAANSSHVTVRNTDHGSAEDAEEMAQQQQQRERVSGICSTGDSTKSAATASGVVLVSCAPTPDLSTWFGQLRLPSGEMVPLGIDQFLPRGCLIRNTDWVLGAVVYTGRHTKMLLNLRPKPNKITNMTRRLNQLNVFLFLLNQSLMFLLCGLAIWSKHHLLRQEPGTRSDFAAWYIQWSLNRYSDATLFWWRYLTNFVLLSYLIPMSLYVTLEFNKAMQMLMIGADKRMAVYDEFTGAIKNARPKTSELNCQLGHVRYIFTDKTGTLTENLMTYVGGVVDGHTHSETEQPGGIGRALLRRRGGRGNDNNITPVGSGAFNAARRQLSFGDDLRHTASAVSGMDNTLTGVPQRSMLLTASGMNVSAMPADGGEAATTTGHGPMLAPATYYMPPALSQFDAHPSSGGGLPLAVRGPPQQQQQQQQQQHRRTASTDSLTRLADQIPRNTASLPRFVSPGTPLLPDPNHARIGSGVGLMGTATSAHHPYTHHQPVPSGSGYQWGSATFNNTNNNAGGGTFLSASGLGGSNYGNNPAAGGGAGLSNVSEVVLDRDPLFRYLRALALCHSIVCFPVHSPSTAASEVGEADAQQHSTTVDEGVAANEEAAARAAALAKAQRRERRAARKAARKEKRRQQRNTEGGANADDGNDAASPPLIHHHRTRGEREEHAARKAERRRNAQQQQQQQQQHTDQRQHRRQRTVDASDVASTGVAGGGAYAHHGSTVGLPPVSSLLSLSDLSAANFVEIPFAVPAGPPRDAFEPYPHNTATDPTSGDNEPITATSSTAFGTRGRHAGHLRSASATSLTRTPTQPALTAASSHPADSGLFNPTAGNLTKLHGRTSSASWYQNRYLNRVNHSRNLSQNSNTNQLLMRSAQSVKTGGMGSPTSPLAAANARFLRNGASASGADGTAAAAAAAAAPGIGGLESFIDRSKLYEGQSLDEIALVNAARENGFSLIERTAKQMYVKALGRVMCYDIIAELEFTPQRKLMSILLQRRPDLDSEGAATTAASGTTAHYHRKAESSLVAVPSAASASIGAASADASAFLHSNNASATFLPATGTRSGAGYDYAQQRAAYCPYTPDTTTLVAPLRAGDDGADAAATAARRQHTALTGLAPQSGNASVEPSASWTRDLPHPASQPSLVPRSTDVARHALHHTRSLSAFASPPVAGLDLPGSVREGGAGGAALQRVTSATTADLPRYLLLVKGADSSMMEIVNMNKRANARVKEKMLAELDAMAQLGLRTLVLGQRYLAEEEVLAWLPVFNEAQCAMQDRSEKLHQAYALLEKDVDIVGTTAVEDKLQDEVPQTLEFCIQASIVVWMLTGDKRETAVTIAHTSGLVSAEYTDFVCHLDVSDIVEEEALLKQQQQHEERARAKKIAGDKEVSDDDDDDDDNVEDDVSVSPSQTPNGQHNSGHTGSRSIDLSTATQPLPGLSCGTRSPGPPSTGDGTAKGGATSPVTAATATYTATTKAASAAPPLLSFAERKAARIEAQLCAAEDKCEEGHELFGTHTVVVVVDGKTLDFIFQDNARAHRFFLLGSRCRSAVCCRMTPLQKAKIVRMFKRNMNAVALAIGDGANDVSMIQESSIGVGIMGLEGSQAELASDYAIPKFRFLKRLLFVHGRFSVFREAHCIVYSLYKNVIVTVGMIAYQFYACYSGQALMDSWLLAMFSIFFCSLQPLMIGILDKDVEDEVAESVPTLYPPLSREFMYFSFPYIGKWLLDGFVEGLFFFFVLMYTVGVQDNLYPHMTPAIEDYGTTFFTMLVLVADFRVGTLVTYYMILFALAVGLEIIFVPIIELVYSAMNNLAGSNWCVKVANELYGTSGKFWMMLFFACGVLVVVTMASNMYVQIFYPWQNAGFAMRAARQSSHRVPYERMKKELKAEYASLLARYAVLRQQLEGGEAREVVKVEEHAAGLDGKEPE